MPESSPTYETLYLKYRPQTFADLVGQEVIARTLRNAILRDRIAHAYLFAGTRGTGKTTTARIFAKALNCLDGREGEPCNRCTACREISGGGAVDILEIDAASNRGIDEIRDLREKVKYLPASLRVKIYIVDEAHMLTTEAFNALLKTLEEPPRHALFVLATTEPHRIPLTVLSRCQRFDFRRIDEDAVAARLRKIAEAEGTRVAEEAVALIARRAEGSMRDAISVLDQLLSSGAREIGTEEARAVLGIADPVEVAALLHAMLAHEPASALRQVAGFYAAGVDVRELLRALMQAVREAALAGATEKSATPAGAAGEPAALLHIWDALLATQAELRRGGIDPRLALELVVLQHALGEGIPGTAPLASTDAPVPTAPKPAAAAPSAAAATSPAEGDRWVEVLRRVLAASRPAHALLVAGKLEGIAEGEVHLRFPTAMLCQKLEERGKMELLQKVLEEVFGRPLKVRCNVAATEGPGSRPRPAGPDEFVRDALSRFDGTITRVTVLEGEAGKPGAGGA